jgi:hypothetical protein
MNQKNGKQITAHLYNFGVRLKAGVINSIIIYF